MRIYNRSLAIRCASGAALVAVTVGVTTAAVASGPDRHRRSSRGQGEASVQLGPRPHYLVDDLPDGRLKARLQACGEGPFASTDFSIGHRGAALQFPEHTRQSYEAAARMGAGLVECDVTFTKDRQLVCRHSQCDLHTTTNILAIPELAGRQGGGARDHHLDPRALRPPRRRGWVLLSVDRRHRRSRRRRAASARRARAPGRGARGVLGLARDRHLLRELHGAVSRGPLLSLIVGTGGAPQRRSHGAGRARPWRALHAGGVLRPMCAPRRRVVAARPFGAREPPSRWSREECAARLRVNRPRSGAERLDRRVSRLSLAL